MSARCIGYTKVHRSRSKEGGLVGHAKDEQIIKRAYPAQEYEHRGNPVQRGGEDSDKKIETYDICVMCRGREISG